MNSPTFGGISWLAHSTLQSGLWINNQQRYNQLVSSQRFTLSDAFKRAGWRTVSDIPSDEADWPQGTSFYHYDTLYDRANVGYVGPKFAYAQVPDQYTLSKFQQNELTPGHAPVMAEIDLVSSHTPWTPLPKIEPWDALGNGSIYDPQPAAGPQPDELWPDSKKVQGTYGLSIQYSLTVAHLVDRAAARQQPGDGDARRSPARDHRQRTAGDARGADLDHRARPERLQPDLVLALAGRAAAELAGAAVADGRLPQPVPDRVRPAALDPALTRAVRAGDVFITVNKPSATRAATPSAIALTHLPVGCQNGSYVFGMKPIWPTLT